MKFLKNLNKKNKAIIISLFIILATGLFLRTYHFSDWLRFNADQVRDTILIKNISEGNKLPDLGPEAGGTFFKLGPAFYYFQLTSAKLFGTEPEKMAYPDLLFSLLSIPLFFLLTQIYFNQKISLALTWLYSLSYFVVKFSRFAWNPNSTLFFVMLFLYALFNLAISEKRKYWWAMTTGLALGICIQLHTSLLIILPIFSIFIAVVFLKKKMLTKNLVALVIVFALLVNIPQIISEIKTRGKNSSQFIRGLESKNTRNGNLASNVFLSLSCHLKTDAHIVSSLGDEDECGYASDIRTIKMLDGKRMALPAKVNFVIVFIFSLAFSIGGYILLFKKTREEKERQKKIFLQLISGYAILSFILYIAWANELSVRFFLPLAFIPFLLLGFWLEYFSIKFKYGLRIVIGLIIIFSFFNLQTIHHTYHDLRYGGGEINGNFDYLTLGEGKYIANFIGNNSENKIAYIDAQAGYLFKAIHSLQFLATKDIEIVQLRKENELGPGDKIFYLSNAKNQCKLLQEISNKYSIRKCETFGQFSIFSLIVK